VSRSVVRTARAFVALAALLAHGGGAAEAPAPSTAGDSTLMAAPAADSVAATSESTATATAAEGSPAAGANIRHAQRSPASKDTAVFALAPLWGLDVAWTLGGSPAFDIWRRSLPRSLANLSLPAYLHGVDGPGDADSARLRFELKDEPNTYNVDFPLGLSWAFLSRGPHGLSAHCAFTFQRKHASAVLRADSVAGKLTLEQSLALLSLGAGLTYTLGIPETFFSVDTASITTKALGVAFDPLTWLHRREDLDADGGTDDSLVAAGRPVSSQLHEWAEYGWGISWTVGVTSVKKLSETGGLVTTVGYQGRWQRFSGLVEDDLRYLGRSEGTPVLSFVSHRFVLMLSLVRGRRPKVEEPGTAAPAAGSPEPAAPEAPATPPPSPAPDDSSALPEK